MSDYKIGSIVPLTGDSKEARFAHALKGLNAITAERDQLRAELEKLRGELDDAEERASEAEERCAAEWEKDCGQALRILAQVTKFEWDQDGSPADEVREHIQMTLESLEKQVVSLRAELAAAKEAIEDIERTLEIAEIPKYGSSGDRIPWNERVELLADESTALAATPAQSLAAHDAATKVAVLREVAVEIDALAAGPDIDTVPTRLEDIANGIRAKADRIAREAANG